MDDPDHIVFRLDGARRTKQGMRRIIYRRNHTERDLLVRAIWGRKHSKVRSATTIAKATAKQREYSRKPGFKIKRNAQAKVRRALKTGRMTRLPCERCGNPKTYGHHPDYSKPFDVIWLCPRCHAKEHKRSFRYGIPEFDSASREDNP